MTIATTQTTNYGLLNTPTAPIQSFSDDKTANNQKQPLGGNSPSISLSQLGKINQEIDVTANTIDSILISGMSKEQKKKLVSYLINSIHYLTKAQLRKA
ncbi:hypothetical protein ACMAZF_05620 [Psychrobium sp. nBUS_13]|uniref:hypothetical protein n=1 Tax=Psychrobium sp. nBUS_13 TaxID=3395319 RepID=UPI003EB97FB5